MILAQFRRIETQKHFVWTICESTIHPRGLFAHLRLFDMDNEVVPIRIVSKALAAKVATIRLAVFLAFPQINRGAILRFAPPDIGIPFGSAT